jgi:hypothetical protein
MKRILQLKFLMMLLFAIVSFDAIGQVKALVDAKQYVFKAESAMPMTATSKTLSVGYDLTVTKDHIVAYLPYFGRATTAPIDPTDGGIKFTSQSYVYNVKTRKGGGWDVIIDFNDVPTVRSMTLTFYDNGSATLDVTSNQRDPISFKGSIVEYKPAKTQARK